MFCFQGYCDVFQKCRAVDAEGPLARLKNLLFNQDTLNSVAEWITVRTQPLLGGCSYFFNHSIFTFNNSIFISFAKDERMVICFRNDKNL